MGRRTQLICDATPSRTFEYARIVGELVDEYKGSRSFKIFNMQPIYDPHEIYFHILHSIFDCLVLEKGPPVHSNLFELTISFANFWMYSPEKSCRVRSDILATRGTRIP